MKKRYPNLGRWLGGGYFSLFWFAYFVPEVSMPVALFKMCVGSMIYPWTLFFEEQDYLILMPFVGALWFWFLGRVFSEATTRLFPRSLDKEEA